MKRIKTILKAVGNFLLILSLGGVLVSTANAEKSVVLRLSMHQSSSSPEMNQIIKPMETFIQSRSKGRIKLKIYADGTLHGASEGFKALATDVTDLAPAYPLYQSRSFHLNHVTNLPLAFPTAYVGGRVIAELYATYFKDEWNKMGCFPLFYPVTATYNLLTRKPVSSIKDIKGMKIRGGGAALNEIIKRLGATPVTIQSPEVYAAFQRGVVDGLLFDTASILAFRLDEIGKYYIPLGISRVGIPWAMNSERFVRLPADVQQVMFEAGREASIHYADYVTRASEAAVQVMKGRGIVIVELPAAELQAVQDAVEPMWQEFIKQNDAEGRPAQALVNALRSKVASYGAMTREQFVELQRGTPVTGMTPGRQ